ncbi:MAG: transposase, partial [Candidatus Nitrosocosmicus sp.]
YVHDINALPGLVETITKSNSITVDKLFADDGTYDSNDIFKCIIDNGIIPCIKVRKNAKVRLKTSHILRNISV